MKRAIGLLLAGALWSPQLSGAEAAGCRLSKGLYEDRLALVQKQAPAEGQAAGALLPPGTVTPADKLAAIDREYRGFLKELSAASERKDGAALQSCCQDAANDHAGFLICQLAQYLNGGRKDSSAFLDTFPSSRKDLGMMWDLSAIAGDAGRTLFPSQGPSYKFVDELFLLVMDQRDLAITRYFNLTSHAPEDASKYMDAQIRIFLKEDPAAVVNQWLVLRRYRPKLKAAVQSLLATTPAPEMAKVVKAVRAFCDKSNPDCPDILKLYAGK